MKFIVIGALTLISSFVNADQQDLALSLLQQMNKATEYLNYEMYYIRVSKNTIDPMKYRHAVVDQKQFSQLAYLAGPNREIIKRANEVSYFEPGIEAYTITSDKIIAPLPVMPFNFTRLKPFYNFVSLGRSREAGLPCQVIRISPKDGERYSYVLWIDERSHLLLRADLLDKEGEPIEQIRSLKLSISPLIADEMKELATINLPQAILQPTRNTPYFHWQIDALPNGFVPITHNSYRLLNTSRAVNNLMFSDGLFSFSIYLSEADEFSLRDRLVRNGRRTLYSKVKGNTEINVVGDIPPDTAKKIANSIRVNPVPFISPKPKSHVGQQP